MTADELQCIKTYIDEKVAYEVEMAIAQLEEYDQPSRAALARAEEDLTAGG